MGDSYTSKIVATNSSLSHKPEISNFVNTRSRALKLHNNCKHDKRIISLNNCSVYRKLLCMTETKNETPQSTLISTILIPTISFGAIGSITGAVVAASRAQPIPLYVFSTGTNFALLGGAFSCFRSVGHHFVPRQNPQRSDKARMTVIAGLAGALTGATFAALPGNNRSYLLTTLCFGTCSLVGEYAHQSILEPPTNPEHSNTAVSEKVEEKDKSVWRKLKETSPLRSVPDDEFREIMEAKLRHLDEQIAAVNEEIVYTKSQIQQRAKQAKETSTDV